jgi:hypothetical protein
LDRESRIAATSQDSARPVVPGAQGFDTFFAAIRGLDGMKTAAGID